MKIENYIAHLQAVQNRIQDDINRAVNRAGFDTSYVRDREKVSNGISMLINHINKSVLSPENKIPNIPWSFIYKDHEIYGLTGRTWCNIRGIERRFKSRQAAKLYISNIK